MSLLDKIDKKILLLKDELVLLRRDFHAHPELGFNEFRTAQIVEDYLIKLGIETKRIAGTGVIGTLRGKSTGKVIALRADMDALPVCEEGNCEYKSQNDGVMHACGHDGHTAILLGVAKHLASLKDDLNGTFRFIFQPAEEGIGGAEPMIKEGCLKNPDVDFIFGLHIWSRFPVGTVGVESGPVMASTSEFEVNIEGKGGHGASPHETVDSIVVASQFINIAQTIVSRSISPLESGVVTFGKIEGGTNFNVIASRVHLKGTIRSMNEENENLIKRRLEEILKGLSETFGAKCSIKHNRGYASLVNHPEATSFVMQAAKELLGGDCIRSSRTMGGEDFSYYVRQVPGCFFFVGAGNEKKGITYPQHHPCFDMDEDALVIGVDIMIRTCLKVLDS